MAKKVLLAVVILFPVLLLGTGFRLLSRAVPDVSDYIFVKKAQRPRGSGKVVEITRDQFMDGASKELFIEDPGAVRPEIPMDRVLSSEEGAFLQDLFWSGDGTLLVAKVQYSTSSYRRGTLTVWAYDFKQHRILNDRVYDYLRQRGGRGADLKWESEDMRRGSDGK